ncbi:hypothetical protein VpaJT1_92 [Vibrio phage VpaJT_1]|nr:hypothetical protein VpaJT1_92 [Vibrio phage VpaJT_1]
MYYDSIEEAIKAAPDCTHVLTTSVDWARGNDPRLKGKFVAVYKVNGRFFDDKLASGNHYDVCGNGWHVAYHNNGMIPLPAKQPTPERPRHLYGSMDDAIKAQPTCTHVLRRTTTQGYIDYVPVVGEYTSTTFKGFEQPCALEYDTTRTEWEVCCQNTAAPTTEQRLAAARFDTASGHIPAHQFLESGVKHMKDRASQRDAEDGERSMRRCVEAFNALEGTNLTETQGWRFMIMLKMARSVSGDFTADDYEDMAAYSGLAGECASTQETN